ncbi:MAG: DUF1284 domain-containing protein [Candidatus Brockarchaeota archaeon]|nr:DUF1284 domain-containing protein [Candidatus Brockarchaeota archaeon]
MEVGKAYRAERRVRGVKSPGTGAEHFEVRAHHLLCAICARGGCESPPAGKRAIGRLLGAVWRNPYLSLKIAADLDVNRAHYLDVYAKRGRRALPRDFWKRQADYVNRRKDLEVLRLLGIAPNSVLPAYLAYSIIFSRIRSLDGICRSTQKSEEWPECPHAREGYYEKVVSERAYGPKENDELGEAQGKGIWAIIRPRTREEMSRAKAASAKRIREASRLFIRPNHLLCILCTADVQEPLAYDNLVEARKRMEEDPEVLVTLTEGCCMVCDPCFEYHPGENICIRTHVKDQLRDLNILEKLGLRPGATLTARKLYEMIYDKIGSLRDICAWGDELDTAPFWSPCGGWRAGSLEKARREGLIARAGSRR